MRDRVLARLTGLGTWDLRDTGRAFGVPPHFVSEGRVKYLKNSTLRQRLAEHADRDDSWDKLGAAIDAAVARGEGRRAAKTGEGETGETMDAGTQAAAAALHSDAGLQCAIPMPTTQPLVLEGQRADAERLVKELVTFVGGVAAGASAPVDADTVRAIVREELDKRTQPRTVVVKLEQVTAAASAAAGKRRLVHKQWEKLVAYLAAGLDVYLCGPAGSGKTFAAMQAAEALGLAFYFNGAIDTEYKLLGYVDAHGRVVDTAFRRAMLNGGLYLFDEIDASLPPALLALNAALGNRLCDFPGMTEPAPRHESTRCVAAANTWGFGADSKHVGRNKLDAASLDRFVKLPWEYDEALEFEVAGNDTWTKRVQALRHKAMELGLQVVISPRASIAGARLIAAGHSEAEALEATVTAGLGKADRQALGVA